MTIFDPAIFDSAIFDTGIILSPGAWTSRTKAAETWERRTQQDETWTGRTKDVEPWLPPGFGALLVWRRVTDRNVIS